MPPHRIVSVLGNFRHEIMSHSTHGSHEINLWNFKDGHFLRNFCEKFKLKIKVPEYQVLVKTENRHSLIKFHLN